MRQRLPFPLKILFPAPVAFLSPFGPIAFCILVILRFHQLPPGLSFSFALDFLDSLSVFLDSFCI